MAIILSLGTFGRKWWSKVKKPVVCFKKMQWSTWLLLLVTNAVPIASDTLFLSNAMFVCFNEEHI